MVHPAVLVVFLISNEADSTLLASLQDSAHEVLGEESQVHVSRIPERLSDDALLERAGPANVVVELWWLDTAGHSVVLHCFDGAQRRWIDRRLTFDPADATTERGRALGFALGSMLDGESPATSVTAESLVRDRSEAPRQPESSPADHEIELSGIASTGVGGTANGFGVMGGLGFRARESLWWSVGAGARFGDIPSAQATTRDLFAQAALSFRPLERRSYRAGVTLEIAASWLVVRHLSADDVKPDDEQRFQGLGRVLGEVGVSMTSSMALVATVGPEFAFGETHVFAHQTQVATIPVTRGFMGLGFRANF